LTRDPRLYIEDILASMDRIQQYTAGLDEQTFLENPQAQDAVLPRLEVIGEAVKGIPESVRTKYAEIPWRNMAGLRDVLIHQYFGVNLHRTWLVVTEDIPVLKPKWFGCIRICRIAQTMADETR
jgi:uncharacterized protein with HEPN domain